MNVFLYDELQTPEILERFKIPLTFVCFGYIEDVKLFKHKKKSIAVPFDAGSRSYKCNKVFGGIYALEEASYYIRILDAYYSCSLSRIGVNHTYDLRHRETRPVIPIQFGTLDDLRLYRFKKLNPLHCQCYIGNTHNEALQTCLKWNKNRLRDGVDVIPFKALCEKEGVR